MTILTTNPTDVMRNLVHDRMPVVLPLDVESVWLFAESDARKELCQPYPKDDLDKGEY